MEYSEFYIFFVQVGGDNAPDNENSSVEIFNRKSGSWSSAPSTRAKRDSCRLAVINGEDLHSSEFTNKLKCILCRAILKWIIIKVVYSRVFVCYWRT